MDETSRRRGLEAARPGLSQGRAFAGCGASGGVGRRYLWGWERKKNGHGGAGSDGAREVARLRPGKLAWYACRPGTRPCGCQPPEVPQGRGAKAFGTYP